VVIVRTTDQIPAAAALPEGEVIFRAQARDLAGNLGVTEQTVEVVSQLSLSFRPFSLARGGIPFGAQRDLVARLTSVRPDGSEVGVGNALVTATLALGGGTLIDLESGAQGSILAVETNARGFAHITYQAPVLSNQSVIILDPQVFVVGGLEAIFELEVGEPPGDPGIPEVVLLVIPDAQQQEGGRVELFASAEGDELIFTFWALRLSDGQIESIQEASPSPRAVWRPAVAADYLLQVSVAAAGFPDAVAGFGETPYTVIPGPATGLQLLGLVSDRPEPLYVGQDALF